MDLRIIIIGSVLLVICILPFVFLANKKRKRKAEIRHALFSLAEANSCKIATYDIFADTAIGIDKNSTSIFFIKKDKDEAQADKVEQIKLSDIAKCRVEKTDLKDANGVVYEIEKLQLVFRPLAAHNPEIALVFFDSQNTSQLHEELLLITKWEALINSKIK